MEFFKLKSRFIFALIMTLAVAFVAGCQLGGDDEEDDSVTVTFYADTISTSPRTATLDKGSVFTCPESYLRAPDDDYTFTAWVSADGTNYTNLAINSNITLFAESIKTTSNTSGTVTTTTTSDVYVVQAKTTIETQDSATGEKTSSETVVSKDTSGNILTTTVTDIAADGSTTITATDESGQTKTTKKDANGNVTSETTDVYLDLRIKKDGVPVNAATVSVSEGATTGTSVSSAHVTATPVEGGIRFDITRPSDEVYKSGFGWCAVNDEYGTRADFAGTSDPSKTTLSLIFPLCTYGKQQTFGINIHNTEGLKAYNYYEEIKITPTAGIGFIDYQNREKQTWMTMSYDGTKPIVEINPNMILPTAVDVQPHYEFWASETAKIDWRTQDATKWICGDYYPDDSTWVAKFNKALKATGKKYFFVQVAYEFKIPDYENLGITKFLTEQFVSDMISLE